MAGARIVSLQACYLVRWRETLHFCLEVFPGLNPRLWREAPDSNLPGHADILRVVPLPRRRCPSSGQGRPCTLGALRAGPPSCRSDGLDGQPGDREVWRGALWTEIPREHSPMSQLVSPLWSAVAKKVCKVSNAALRGVGVEEPTPWKHSHSPPQGPQLCQLLGAGLVCRQEEAPPLVKSLCQSHLGNIGGSEFFSNQSFL